MRNFKELKVWQKGFQIAVDAYKLTASFPSTEKFAITSQITRAAVSIASNIAEGSSRSSEKDYKRFLEISLGSTFELETQLLIAKEANLGQLEAYQPLLSNIDEEQKMLIAFISKLKY